MSHRDLWVAALLIVASVGAAGCQAQVRGTYSMSLQIPGLPESVPQQGKLLQIYARQPAGSWLLARDIWNADSAPTGP